MQLDKYISDIKDGIDKLNKWPSKMLTERSIEITERPCKRPRVVLQLQLREKGIHRNARAIR